MSLIIDHKYIALVSSRLPLFKQKDTNTWQCRCVLCGDSQKSKNKARGYFFRKAGNIVYKCHNCHVSISLGNFLKKVDPSLYRDYQLEKYKEHTSGNVKKPDFSLVMTKPVFSKKLDIGLPSIDKLDPDHSARRYITQRKIPKDKWDRIFYTDDFKTFCDKQFPSHGKKLMREEPRIVLPFYDAQGGLLGVQGRALLESSIRYITMKINEDAPKLYGLNTLNTSKTIHVVEGPFDSLFLPNSVATMDGSLTSVLTTLGNHDYVFVFDNQPRNPQVVDAISKAIDMNQKVVIWPMSLVEKDINDMVLAGHDVMSIIQGNTYQGLKALLNFKVWRKIDGNERKNQAIQPTLVR